MKLIRYAETFAPLLHVQSQDSKDAIFKESRNIVTDTLEIPIQRRETAFSNLYFLNVSFGTPEQPMDLLSDKGSTSDTWVYGNHFYGRKVSGEALQCCKSSVYKRTF